MTAQCRLLKKFLPASSSLEELTHCAEAGSDEEEVADDTLNSSFRVSLKEI